MTAPFLSFPFKTCVALFYDVAIYCNCDSSIRLLILRTKAVTHHMFAIMFNPNIHFCPRWAYTHRSSQFTLFFDTISLFYFNKIRCSLYTVTVRSIWMTSTKTRFLYAYTCVSSMWKNNIMLVKQRMFTVGVHFCSSLWHRLITRRRYCYLSKGAQ